MVRLLAELRTEGGKISKYLATPILRAYLSSLCVTSYIMVTALFPVFRYNQRQHITEKNAYLPEK